MIPESGFGATHQRSEEHGFSRNIAVRLYASFSAAYFSRFQSTIVLLSTSVRTIRRLVVPSLPDFPEPDDLGGWY